MRTQTKFTQGLNLLASKYTREYFLAMRIGLKYTVGFFLPIKCVNGLTPDIAFSEIS